MRHQCVPINLINFFLQYLSGYWLFHCHIEFHAEIGMSLIFKVGENEEMPPVPNNFPKCGDWKPTVNENKYNLESNTTSMIEGKQSKNNKVLADMIKQFSIYVTYFEQLLKLPSSASSSNITLLLFIACLLSSVIRMQIF